MKITKKDLKKLNESLKKWIRLTEGQEDETGSPKLTSIDVDLFDNFVKEQVTNLVDMVIAWLNRRGYYILLDPDDKDNNPIINIDGTDITIKDVIISALDDAVSEY